MLQPGNDALGRDCRLPGHAGNMIAVQCDPVGHQRSRIGRGEVAVSGPHVAEPAKAMQALQPARVGTFDLEWRLPSSFHYMTGQRKAPVIDLQRNLRVGQPEVRWRDQDALRRPAGITPAIDGATAQAPPRTAPHFARDQHPQMCGVAVCDAQGAS